MVLTFPYKPLYPEFMYQYLDIPNWKIIANELLKLSQTNVDKIERTPKYFNCSRTDTLIMCPELTKWLTEARLINKFDRTLFSKNTIDNGSPHVDTIDARHSTWSINFPLMECENSYTSFYESSAGLLTSTQKYNWFQNYGMCYGEYKEIDRVEYNQPVLINTSILHRATSNNPNRVIAGLRFYPSLTISEINLIKLE